MTQTTLRDMAAETEAYEDLCKELGKKPADMAMAWLLQNPAVNRSDYGAATKEQLSEVGY